MFRESCGQILGCQTFEEGNHFARLFNDLDGLSWWESTQDLSELFIGLSGISYSGEENQDYVLKRRYPAVYLFDNLKISWATRKKYRIDPKLTLKLHEDVHPSLEEVAKATERLVHLFTMAVKQTMVNYGHNTHTREIDVSRLARSAATIYAMTSALGRANRTYCDGHRHAENNLLTTISYINNMVEKVEYDIVQASKTEVYKYDPIVKSRSVYMAEQGGYAAVHPLTKNLF